MSALDIYQLLCRVRNRFTDDAFSASELLDEFLEEFGALAYPGEVDE